MSLQTDRAKKICFRRYFAGQHCPGLAARDFCRDGGWVPGQATIVGLPAQAIPLLDWRSIQECSDRSLRALLDALRDHQSWRRSTGWGCSAQQDHSYLQCYTHQSFHQFCAVRGYQSPATQPQPGCIVSESAVWPRGWRPAAGGELYIWSQACADVHATLAAFSLCRCLY
jgi:hypothetical protein